MKRLPDLWDRRDVVLGALLYPAGDSVASVLIGEFSWLRVFGVGLAGSLLYSLEIPAWFRGIDRWTAAMTGLRRSLARSLLATIYFNPLWVARHMLVLCLFGGKHDQIGWNLLATGHRSFVAVLPVGLVVNYAIQNSLPQRHRFLASSLFTALMAVYYAASQRWFG